jgi:hypothetical protein
MASTVFLIAWYESAEYRAAAGSDETILERWYHRSNARLSRRPDGGFDSDQARVLIARIEIVAVQFDHGALGVRQRCGAVDSVRRADDRRADTRSLEASLEQAIEVRGENHANVPRFYELSDSLMSLGWSSGASSRSDSCQVEPSQAQCPRLPG